MAWRERTTMSEREEFVAMATTGDVSFQELCRRFEIRAESETVAKLARFVGSSCYAPSLFG